MTFCFFRERLTIYSKSSKIKLLGLNAILSCNYDNIGYCCIVGGGNRDMSNMQILLIRQVFLGRQFPEFSLIIRQLRLQHGKKYSIGLKSWDMNRI